MQIIVFSPNSFELEKVLPNCLEKKPVKIQMYIDRKK